MNRNERRRLAKTDPNAWGAALRKAFSKHQSGDFQAAEKGYREILGSQPKHPDAARLLGELLIDTGRAGLAVTFLRPLANADPSNSSVAYSLANACRMAGRIDEAVVGYAAAIKSNPGFAGAHHGLGAALRAAGRYEAAADSFATAARLDPKFPAAWAELGMVFAALGKLGLAEAALERALARDPGLAETRRHLLALRETPVPGDIAALQAIQRDQTLPFGAKIENGFALGKLLDKAGRFDEAFEQLNAANQLLRESLAAKGIGFDRARLTSDVDRLISIFTLDALNTYAKLGVGSSLPVFIVGMPRSGTTLIEQIAASHRAVFGAGELKAIGGIASKIGWAPTAKWSEKVIRDAADTHLAALAAQGEGALRVIDKMPDNIFQLGLIAGLFPNARIIFCERDPLDTCFSCFTQRFAEPYGFDTDLSDCGFRYREISRLTQHWQAVLPLPMLRVSYEAMVRDPEAESRRLIEFLGLEWDAACLDFHRTERVVTTASWAQVRQPLYSHAVGRAKNYIAYLSPLITALTQI